MPKKDQKVTHDGEVITISRPQFKHLVFATYTEELFNQISSVTWFIAKSKNGKEYVKSSKYGYLHHLVVKHFYGNDVFNDAIKSNMVIDHLDNNGYENTYENLAIIPRNENSAKGLTFDIERNEAKRKFVINITKDMETEEFQISVIFNIPYNLISSEKNYSIPLHVLYFRYGTDYKTAFMDARSILNDLNMNGIIDFSKFRYKDFTYREAKVVHVKPEELNNGTFIIDGHVYLVQGSPHIILTKVRHNKELHSDK